MVVQDTVPMFPSRFRETHEPPHTFVQIFMNYKPDIRAREYMACKESAKQ